MDNASAAALRLVRRRPATWWRQDAGDGSRADVVARLVATYAVAGQAVEVGDWARAGTYRVPGRPGRDGVLADQLTVVAYDLVDALRAAGAAADAIANDVVAETNRFIEGLR